MIRDITGYIIFGVLIVIPISAVVRLVVAAFSPSIRLSIRKHPVAHGVWFVGGILSIAFFIAVSVIVGDYARRHAEKVKQSSLLHNGALKQ